MMPFKIPPAVVVAVIVGGLVALFMLTRSYYRLSARWSTGSLELSPAAPPAASSSGPTEIARFAAAGGSAGVVRP